jgi:hypothetical protein
MPIVLTNPEVKRLNSAIVALTVKAGTSRSVIALYDRWVRFIGSPTYQLLPDTSLYPIFKAFGVAYVVIARANNIAPTDVDPSLLVLAAGDAQNTVDAVGRALDQTLEAAGRIGVQVTKAAWVPAALVIAILVAVGYAKRG